MPDILFFIRERGVEREYHCVLVETEKVKGLYQKGWERGAWVAQSVKRPTSARSRSRGP